MQQADLNDRWNHITSAQYDALAANFPNIPRDRVVVNDKHEHVMTLVDPDTGAQSEFRRKPGMPWEAVPTVGDGPLLGRV